MNRDKDPDTLCFFEYYDRKGNKNHLCLACAECEALDQVVDSCVRGKKPRDSDVDDLKADVIDRLRVPAFKGARKLDIDLLLPNLVIGSILMLGSIHLIFALPAPFLLNCFVGRCYQRWRRGHAPSKMFLYWGPSCLAWLYAIAVLHIAPQCTLTCVVAVHCLFTVFLVGMWRTRTSNPGVIAPQYSTKSDSDLPVALPVGVCTSCGAVETDLSRHCRSDIRAH